STGDGSHASVALTSNQTSAQQSPLDPRSTTMSSGQLITGPVLSSTKAVCEQLAALPQASVAVHVRMTTYSCGQSPGKIVSTCDRVGSGSQVSMTMGGSKTGVSGHSTLIGPPQVMVGAVSSSTNSVVEQLLALPQWSITVQVRTIEYSCGQLPG